jgi:hypothetical protein
MKRLLLPSLLALRLAFADTPENWRFNLALYSWQSDDKAWHFVLIPEPARTPNRASFIGLGPPLAVVGSDALKSWLSRLASGSRTNWTIIWRDDANHTLQYPSASFCDDIVTFGKQRGLNIVISPTLNE